MHDPDRVVETQRARGPCRRDFTNAVAQRGRGLKPPFGECLHDCVLDCE